MSDEALIEMIVAISTAFAAIAATASAVFSSSAARSADKALRAQLMMRLLDEYASQEMLDALALLASWAHERPSDFDAQFGRARLAAYADVRALDAARRRVSHYFTKVHRLLASGVLSVAQVEKVLTPDQVTFYIAVIRPLEAAVNDAYETTPFDAFARIFGVDPACSIPGRGQLAPPAKG